jgi:hypothetical protein
VAACNPIHPAVLLFDRVQRALAMGKLPDLEDCKAYSAAMERAAASAGQEPLLWTERALGCPEDWRPQLGRLGFERTLKGWVETQKLSARDAFSTLSRYFNRRWPKRPTKAEDDVPFLLLTLHGGLPRPRHIEDVLKRASS